MSYYQKLNTANPEAARFTPAETSRAYVHITHGNTYHVPGRDLHPYEGQKYMYIQSEYAADPERHSCVLRVDLYRLDRPLYTAGGNISIPGAIPVECTEIIPVLGQLWHKASHTELIEIRSFDPVTDVVGYRVVGDHNQRDQMIDLAALRVLYRV